MRINKIRADYLKCAQRWIELGGYQIATSYFAVLQIPGIETWTPREREQKRIELMNTLKEQ